MKSSESIPEANILQRLAINESGFVFDPVSGHSFTTNESGIALLQVMMHERKLPSIIKKLKETWDVDSKLAERDLFEFVAELRKALKG